MVAERALLALLIVSASQAQAQAQAPRPNSGAPVIACASLANLRSVLRNAKDDPVAAIPLINDPAADLGCSLLDKAAVTAITDRVTLNGRSYDCVGLQSTGICHWTVAGAVKPPDPAAAKPAEAAPPKARR